MKRLTQTLALFALGLMASVAVAEKDKAEQKLKIGQPAPAFELPDVDGTTHSLESYQGQWVVLHFESPRCPWDRGYQPILNDIADQFSEADESGQGVVFLAINANKNEEPAMLREWAQEAQMPYPILKDEGNKVADAYHARFTPHMYVIDPEGVLRYQGGIEKAPLSPAGVGKSEQQYLQPVLEAALAGEELPVTDTQAIGCGIKRANK